MDGDPSLADFWKAVGTIFLVCLVIGAMVLALTGALGPLANEIENNLFNTSQQHTGAVAQKFSDDCLQLTEATTPSERKAIENDIYTVASTVNLNNIQMPDTTRACVNKAIQDVTNSH